MGVKMDNLYGLIKNRDNDKDLFLSTIISGEFCGEKILVCDGEVIYKSRDILSDIEKELITQNETKVINLFNNSVYIEKIGGRIEIVICGAGHVSIPVIQIAKMVGFYVTVIDDRQEFVDKALKNGADNGICGEFETVLKSLKTTNDTYFVVVTRGHHFDKICVENALLKPHAYVGLLGSKNKAVTIKNKLTQQGFDHELIESVHAPIGLKINAEGPQEIAVSIMSEIIKVKNTSVNSSVFDDELLSYLANENYEKCVIATIVAKSGSTPRKVGTKLLIKEDGNIIGTVGGGVCEKSVIDKALSMMKHNENNALVKYNMFNDGKNGEDMICGGNIDVFLQLI